MRIKSKFWVESDKGQLIFCNKRIRLLEAINQHGSIKEAAENLDITPRRAGSMIKSMEKHLAVKLLQESKGAGKVKSFKLTAEAAKIIQNFNQLHQEGCDHADMNFERRFKGRFNPVVPVIGVVGLEGSGRTAIIKSLIKEFSHRGIKVGLIEQLPREQETKPSQPGIIASGAGSVIVSGAKGLTVHVPADELMQPEIVADNYLPGMDLALVKSSEKLNIPSIDVFRKKLGKAPIIRKRKNLITVTGDKPAGSKKYPHVKETDIVALADIIEKRALRETERERLVELKVNGRRVPMLSFVEDMISSTVIGLVASLKSCDKAGDIELTVRRD